MAFSPSFAAGSNLINGFCIPNDLFLQVACDDGQYLNMAFELSLIEWRCYRGDFHDENEQWGDELAFFQRSFRMACQYKDENKPSKVFDTLQTMIMHMARVDPPMHERH